MKRASFLISTFLFLLSLAFLTWKVEANDLTCCYIIQDLSIEIDDRLVAGPGGFFDLTKEPPEIPPKPVILRSQISDPDPTIKVNFLEQIDPNNGSIDFAFFDEFPEGRGVYLLHKISQPEFLNESPEGRFLIDGNFSLVHSTIPANDLNFTTQESVFVNFGELPAFGSQNAQSGLYRLIVAGYPEFKYIYNDDPVCFDGSLSQQEWDGLCVSIEPYTDQDFKRWYEWRYFATQEYQGGIPETYEPAQYVKFEFEYVAEPEHSVNPVIVIPGIMGSAKKNGELLIDPILHTYDDLIATLEANGYQKEKNLFTFPYEWRDSNVLTANLLKQKISAVKTACEAAKENNEISTELGITDCSKVDLVAHSMGGLVAREYAQSTGYRRDIDQLIFLGTPHQGSQKAYLQWEAGESDRDFISRLSNEFFNAEALRNGFSNVFDYVRNRPISSVKELLPTFDYLVDDDTGTLRTYPDDYPRNTFLEYLNSEILNLVYSGIEITNIVGNTGNNTIEKIRVVPTTKNGLWEHGQPEDFYQPILSDNGLERGVGDNTVTVGSAHLDSAVSDEEVSSSHGRIPTEQSNYIFKILTNKDSTINIDSGFNLDVKILIYQLLSPIDVVITAPDGKKIGKNFATGQEYNEIPGAFYSGFNNSDEEYITIPNPIDGEYKIEVQGTDNGGEYGILTSLISEATSTTNQIVGITKPNQITELTTDVADQAITQTERVITLEVFKNDINGAYDLGWIKDKKTRDVLIKQVEGAVKLQKRIETIYEKLPDGKKKEKKIEKIELKVNKILLKLFEKELDLLFKKDKINKEALDLLKLDIKYLLNNN